MPKASPIQTNMTGGEVSPKLYGRVDTAKYQNGMKTIENFVVMPHGGARKRPGTKHVHTTKDNGAARLVPFVYNADQAYMLEFGNLYIRFFTNGGILTQTAQDITGISKANPGVVTYSGSDTYANGDRVIISGVVGMTEVNGREFTVANVDTGANTFELSGVNTSSYTTYSSAGTVAEIIEVVTTYATAELDDLSFTQSADTLFIADTSHALAKLVRNSATSWTLSNVSVLRGPWRNLNPDETITIKANDLSGAGITLESSASLFNTLHVGAKFKLHAPSRGTGETDWGNPAAAAVINGIYSYNGNTYEITAVAGSWTTDDSAPPTHSTGTVRQFLAGATTAYADVKFLHKGYGIVSITAYASATSVTATVYSGYGYLQLPAQLVDSAMSGGAAANARYKEPTSFWQEGAWSDYRGHPGILCLYEQRLMAANNGSQTQTIWGSVSGNFTDFEEGVLDDQALNYTLGSEQADVIRWMSPGKQLLVGTTDAEYVVSASSLAEAVTPTNIKVSRETTYGSSPCNPVRVGNAVLFMQRRGDPDNAGRKMREMAYSFEIDAFVANELTIWSEHITGEGVTRLAYQADPDSLVWGVRADGYLPCLTYERSQEVVAWHKHWLGGYSDSGQSVRTIVEQAASIPGTNSDELWVVAKRYINGGTVRYIEYLSHWDAFVDKEDGIFMDSAITYSGSAATSITGLWHLIGQTVTVLADGAVIANKTVSATGTITLSTAASTVHVGLPYTSVLETLDIEAGTAQGTAQGKQKRIHNVTLRVDRSLGGSAGSSSDRNDPLIFNTAAEAATTSAELYTGDKSIPMPSGWDASASVYISHAVPLPFTVIAIMPDMTATG